MIDNNKHGVCYLHYLVHIYVAIIYIFNQAVLDTLERYPNRTEIHHLGSACLITLNQAARFQQTPTTTEFRRQARRGITLLLISINIHHGSFEVRSCCSLVDYLAVCCSLVYFGT